MDAALRSFKRYLDIGVNHDNSHHINQQIFVSNLFSLIGYTITFVLGLSSFFKGNYVLASSLFFASLLFFIAHHIHNFPKLGNTLKVSTSIVWLSLVGLEIYLVYTGGHENTGPLWIYIVPPVAFFFGGMRKGLVNIGIFIIIIFVMLFAPYENLVATYYSYDFRSRLIYSFLTVTLLFGFYEYSRQKSFQFIRDLSEKFEQQAMQDPLTGLSNRRGMWDNLKYEYNRSLRSKSCMSLLICDIDHFKQINDKYLHEGGDYVLQKLSALFVETLRKQDKVSRWGGEEFLILLPETDCEHAFVIAEKIRNRVNQTRFICHGKEISVTMSIGLAEATESTTIEQAIDKADQNLYLAKQSGRDQTKPSKFDHSTLEPSY